MAGAPRGDRVAVRGARVGWRRRNEQDARTARAALTRSGAPAVTARSGTSVSLSAWASAWASLSALPWPLRPGSRQDSQSAEPMAAQPATLRVQARYRSPDCSRPPLAPPLRARWRSPDCVEHPHPPEQAPKCRTTRSRSASPRAARATRRPRCRQQRCASDPLAWPGLARSARVVDPVRAVGQVGRDSDGGEGGRGGEGSG